MMGCDVSSGINVKDKVTIVVTTYNRYAYLERLLSFYEKQGFPFSILVLDSSTDQVHSPRLQELLGHGRVTHKRYPEALFLAKKIAQGLEHVTAPYAVICADDDFAVPRGIEACAKFLEGAPDYSIAQGFFINHTIKRDRSGRPRFFWGPLYEKQQSALSDMPSERIRFAWNGFNGVTWYSVFRTPLLRLVWKEAGNCTTNYMMAENLMFLLGLIYSKVKVLPVFFNAREMNTYNWFTRNLMNEYYAQEPTAKLVNCAAGHLSRFSAVSEEEARRLVQEVLDAYLHRLSLKMPADAGPGHKAAGSTVKSFGVLIRRIFRQLAWRAGKFRYWLRFRLFFRGDLSQVKACVMDSGIDPDALRSSRESYMKLNKAE
jgi:glycosyltransferase domain-containing protein